MGRYDNLIKLLKAQGKNIAENATAHEILPHITTPEQMLTKEALGNPRAEYIKALEDVYGSNKKTVVDRDLKLKKLFGSI